MEKTKPKDDILEAARWHLDMIDLICRLLLLAAATPGFTLNEHAVGHLAGLLLCFRNRQAEILAREGV